MDYSLVNKTFIADFNINDISVSRQSWHINKQTFYVQQSRIRFGLFLITDYPVLYEMPDNTSFLAKVGDIVLLPRKSTYTAHFIVPDDKISHPLLISFYMTDKKGEKLLCGNKPFVIPHSGENMYPLFDNALEHYQHAHTLKLKSTVYEILGKLFPIGTEDECCLDYINNNFKKNFKVDELAKRCYLSETTYRKRFKHITGMSPIQYINKMKIEKACQMLLDSDMTSKEISEFLNFYSLQYFYRIFNQIVGMTPKQYRHINT